MNIFILSENPIDAAQMLHNRHVVKMILESAQMISCTIRAKPNGEKFFNDWSHIIKQEIDEPDFVIETIHSLLKITHQNHPANVWLREKPENFYWLTRHLSALLDEYFFRFEKIHEYRQNATLYLLFAKKCMEIEYGSDISDWPKPSDFELCMPTCYKSPHSATQSYQNYYIREKLFTKNGQTNKYTKRRIPFFILDSKNPKAKLWLDKVAPQTTKVQIPRAIKF